jgi:hypothetical protein
MPKMRERCASLFARTRHAAIQSPPPSLPPNRGEENARRSSELSASISPPPEFGGRSGGGPSPRAFRWSNRLLRALVPLAFLLLLATPRAAHAAARRIALIHAEAELTRSVDLALYPWDIAVIVVAEPLPDPIDPAAAARAIAKRHEADAVVWVERSSDATKLWFFDATEGALHSRTLPPSPREDPAFLAAVALTLKTFVRATPWESRLPTVVRERKGSGWETRLALDALGRAPLGGTSGEPRLGLWISEWYGTSSTMIGAALGASAGLGMTFENATAHGSFQDIDLRSALRARLLPIRHFVVEPSLGLSAHIERAEIATASPATSTTFTRVDPSIDFGLGIGWQASETFTWSVGIEALQAIRYQRWLEGDAVVFAPASLWIQGGTSIAWSFR